MPSASCCTSLLLLGTLFVSLAAASAAEPAEFPPWRQVVQEIQFTGDLVFPVDRVRGELARDPDVRLASYPRFDPEKSLPVLKSRLTATYRNLGFPDVVIAPRWAQQAQRLTIEIQPGVRIRCGKVEITGVDAELHTVLEEWIVKPRPKKDSIPHFVNVNGQLQTRWAGKDQNGQLNSLGNADSALWDPAKFATFHRTSVDHYAREIERGLQWQGYYQASFDVDVRRETDDTATLAVSVTELGEQARIADVSISGLKRHTAGEILAWLDVKPGDPVSARLRADVEQKISASGQFLAVDFQYQAKADARFSLRLKLYENNLAAARTEEPEEREIAARRLADWLNQLSSTDEELSFEFRNVPGLPAKENVVRTIWSPANKAIWAEITVLSPASGRPVSQLSMFVDQTGIHLLAWPRRESLVIPRVDRQQVILTGTWVSMAPDAEDRSTRMFFGTGFRSHPTVANTEQGILDLPVVMNALVLPSPVIREFRHKDSQYSRDGDIVTIGHPGYRLTMEYETGRLQEVVFYRDEDTFGSVRIGRNLLEPARRDFLQQTQAARSILNPAQPVTSLLQFLPNFRGLYAAESADDADADAETQRRIDTAQHILAQGMFRQFDELFVRWFVNRFAQQSSDYYMPIEYRQQFHFLIDGGAMFVDRVFGRDSWATRIWLDCATLTKRLESPVAVQMSTDLFADAQNEQWGPVGDWLMGTLLSPISPTARMAYGNLGWKKLSTEAVANDLEALLTGDSTLARVTDDLILAIGDCSVDDWDHFAEGWSDEAVSEPLKLIGRLCREAKQDSASARRQLLEILAHDFLEPWLRNSLHHLRTPPPQAAKG